MIRFIISIAVLATLLASSVFAGVQWHWFSSIPSYSIEIISFLGIATTIIFYLLIRRAGSSSFTQSYLLSIVLKMLAYCIFILIVIFSDRSGAFANAVLFMISYLLFTALEVGFLFGSINRRNGQI